MGGVIFNSSSGVVDPFSLGITGLNAARMALQVIGHNIANVNTPGYSRQEHVQTTMRPITSPVGAIGRGVQIIGIRALRDRLLEVQLAGESREQGRLRAADGILGQIESIMNPIDGGGMNDATNNLFGSFHDLAANPENIAQRQETLAFADNLATRNREVITRLKSLTGSINEQIRSTAEEVNSILEEIANANVQIAGGEATGLHNQDYLDRRNYLVRQLNELMNVEYYEDELGATTVTTKNGAILVVRGQHAELGTAENSLDANRLDIYSTFNDARMRITDTITSGKLGGLLEQRDEVLTEFISRQNRFAVVMADAVNRLHRMGTDLDGNAGGDFFASPFSVSDFAATADLTGITVVGEHSTFEVNYEVTDYSGGADITDIQITDPSQVDKHDYRFEFTAAGVYDLVDSSTGQTVVSGAALVGNVASFRGIDVTFDNPPAAGDAFELTFGGATGVDGHVYRIDFGAAGAYDIYDVTELDDTPIASGALAGPNDFILINGLAITFDVVPANGERFVIDYGALQVDSAVASDPTLIAASGSAPGSPEPGNNVNALRLANLGTNVNIGLDDRSFALFQANETSRVGTYKRDSAAMLSTQEAFVGALEMQRESVSGVSLDEEAAALIEYQQAYQANARFISLADEVLTFLLNQLLR